MKLTNLAIESILGIAHATIAIDSPITLFAGRNAAGKSSLMEAIYLGFIGAPRTKLQKQKYDLLVHNGGPTGGSVNIQTSGGEAYTILPDGKHAAPFHLDPDTLKLVLEAQSFGRLSPNDRRTWLLRLAKVGMQPHEIGERLAKRGVSQKRVEVLLPHLVGGFEPAQQYADNQAKEYRGVWRGLTTKNYGSKIAESWAVPVPEVDRDQLEKDRAELTDYRSVIEDWAKQVGDAMATNRAADQEDGARAGWKRLAETIPQVKARIETEEKGLKAAIASREALRDLIGEEKPVHACPHCAGAIEVKTGPSGTITLAPYQGKKDADPAAKKKFDTAEKSIVIFEANLKRIRAELAGCEEAEHALAKPATVQRVDVRRIQAELDISKEKIGDLEARVRQMDDLAKQAAAATELNEKAKRAHMSVVAWAAISDFLKPDGIPAEILGEALVPFNARLALSAERTQWPRVFVTPEMEITVDGRPYGAPFTNTSNNYRADAMFAEAIAHASGLKFMTLDGIDVLDGPGRSRLLLWLDEIVSENEMDAIVVAGTLKELPKKLPESIRAYWVDGGRVLDT